MSSNLLAAKNALLKEFCIVFKRCPFRNIPTERVIVLVIELDRNRRQRRPIHNTQYFAVIPEEFFCCIMLKLEAEVGVLLQL